VRGGELGGTPCVRRGDEGPGGRPQPVVGSTAAALDNTERARELEEPEQ